MESNISKFSSLDTRNSLFTKSAQLVARTDNVDIVASSLFCVKEVLLNVDSSAKGAG